MKDMLHNSDLKGTEVKKAGGSLYTFPCQIACENR
jgi:hypothetical protein